MHEHEHRQKPRHHEGVQAVEAREGGLANAFATAKQFDHEIANYRDCRRHAGNDFHGPVANLIPRQGVTGHTEGDRDYSHGHASDPGELTGTLKATGEVHAEHVEDEHQHHH